MQLLEIVQYPAEVLRKPCSEVKDISGSLIDQIEAMFQTMYDAPGVGLAAPQVGVSERYFVMDPRTDDIPSPLALINPVICERRGLIVGEEGCLSIPGYFAEVERAEHISLRAIDRGGADIELELSGFPAVVAQHEIDHLDGVLFTDYLSKTRKRLFERDFGKDKFRWKYKS